jgi:DNA repair exonuclease SbcCD ATPase subunit
MTRMSKAAHSVSLVCSLAMLTCLIGGCVTPEKLNTAIAETKGQLQTEIADVRSVAQTSADEVKALQARVDALDAIPARLDELDAKIAAVNEKLAELQKLQALETRVADAEAALGRHETAVGSTREDLGKAVLRIDGLDKLAPLLATKDALYKYSQETDKQLTILGRSDKDIQDSIDTIREFMATAGSDLQNLKVLYQKVDLASKNSVESVQSAIDRQNNLLTRDRAALIQVMEAQAQTLTDQTSKLKTAVEKLREALPAPPASAPTPEAE